MAVALPSLLQPHSVRERISRLRVINTNFQNTFGFQDGGPNVRRSPSGRRGSYDVFNDTRDVPNARLPGATSETIARHPRGNVPYVIPRAAEKKPLLLEELNQLRPLGGPVDAIDEAGTLFITDEEAIMRQRMVNLREFQTAAMLRGSYTYTQTGDALVHGFSGGGITIDYQVPAGNKSQLNMLGGGDIIGTAWDNAAAPIISDLLQVNAAFLQLVGRGLTEVRVTSVVWGFIAANTQVQAHAGSVNTYFNTITRDDGTEQFRLQLRGAPWIDIIIDDSGLNVNGTFTKLIPDTAAIFLARPGSWLARYYICNEPIVDERTGSMQTAFGEHYWYGLKADPASYILYSAMNGLPVLMVPDAIAFATVDF